MLMYGARMHACVCVAHVYYNMCVVCLCAVFVDVCRMCVQ